MSLSNDATCEMISKMKMRFNMEKKVYNFLGAFRFFWLKNLVNEDYFHFWTSFTVSVYQKCRISKSIAMFNIFLLLKLQISKAVFYFSVYSNLFNMHLTEFGVVLYYTIVLRTKYLILMYCSTKPCIIISSLYCCCSPLCMPYE